MPDFATIAPPSAIVTRAEIERIATPEMTAFCGYWDRLRQDAFAPTWDAFDLSALDPRSLPHVVVVDVIQDPLDFVIRFWGTAHVARKGVEKTGKSVNDWPVIRKNAAFDEYRWVATEKKPLASRDIVDLQGVSGKLPFEQTLIRLPLSSDGENVTHIVSLAVWEKA